MVGNIFKNSLRKQTFGKKPQTPYKENITHMIDIFITDNFYLCTKLGLLFEEFYWQHCN